MEKCVYFTDQFFSSGRTDIYNESQEKLGKLDLKSAFTSSVSVENEKGEVIVEGSFPFLSGKWTIKQPNGKELGEVKASFSFFAKRYHYTTNFGRFEFESPAFSKEYTILDGNKAAVATFKKVSGIFQAAAYELRNFSDFFLTEELIAVVMGVNAIEKRRSSSDGGGAGAST